MALLSCRFELKRALDERLTNWEAQAGATIDAGDDSFSDVVDHPSTSEPPCSAYRLPYT
jgi:hypothetical protein